MGEKKSQDESSGRYSDGAADVALLQRTLPQRAEDEPPDDEHERETDGMDAEEHQHQANTRHPLERRPRSHGKGEGGDGRKGAEVPFQVVIDITCETFDYEKEVSQDRITIEWVDAPAGQKAFNREWFQGSGCLRRKVMPIEYNL